MKQLRVTIAASSKGSDSLSAAADWLANYLECSWDVSSKYLRVKWVLDHLAPLQQAVPMSPTTSQLYRIITRDAALSVGDAIRLPAKKLLSFTTGKGEAFWTDLADQIGASNSRFCYVVRPDSPIEVFNTKWALGPALRYLRKHLGDAEGTNHLEQYADYINQKEVVGYFDSPTSATIIKQLKV